MAFLIPIAITAASAIAVEKIIQAATGQSMRRTTIPIGPFSIGVGAGKPTFGMGLNIPLTKSGNVGISFGVALGSGKKPSWNVGVNFAKSSGDKKLAFNVKPEIEWTGSKIKEGDPSVSANISKYNSEADFYKNNPQYKLEAKWDKKKLSLSVGNKTGKITLTNPREGGVLVDVEAVYTKKIDKKTGKEAEILAGIRFGKGKPIFKIGGAIDLNKNFRIELDKKFGSEINQLQVSVARYKTNKAGAREKIAQKGTYKYNEQTKTTTLELKGKEMIPLSFNIENNKVKNVLVDTQVISDYVAKKLLPYPKDVSWQKKVGALVSEEMLKGVKMVSGEKIPDKVMQFLAANFGGGELEGIPLERALGKQWTDFVDRYAFGEKEPEQLKNWQVDFLSEFSKSTGIPGKYEKLKPLLEKIQKPSTKDLLSSFLGGRSSLKDFVEGTSYSIKDIEEKYYDVMKTQNQLSTMDSLRNYLRGDPIEVGSAIKALFDKQPAGKAAVVEAYGKMPEEIKRGPFETWQRALQSIKNIARGIPELLSLPINMLGPAPGTEYETVVVGNMSYKVPITRYWESPEGRKMVKDYAISFIKAFTIDPLKRGGNVINESLKVAEEHPVLAMITGAVPIGGKLYGGVYPTIAALWRKFSDDPVGMMIDASIVSSNLKVFSQQARFSNAITRPEAAGLASAGLAYEPGLFAEKTLDIASALEKASSLTDPMNAIFGSAKYGATAFLNNIFPEQAKLLKTKTDLSEISAEVQRARLVGLVSAERDLQSSFKNYPWNKTEEASIRRAMATGDTQSLTTAINPTEAFESGGKQISKLQAAYDMVSENRYLENIRKRLAMESGIMDVEQMRERIFADAEKTYGLSRAELAAKGFEPSYVPYLAKQSIDLKLQDALNTLKPRFEKEFVGDITSVDKMSLERAIIKHEIDFTNKAYDSMLVNKFVNYAKEQGFAVPWKPGQTLEKGNVIFDPYRYMEKNKLAGEFNNKFFENITKMNGNAEAALQTTLAEYSTLESAAGKLSKLMNPDLPVFQMKKSTAAAFEGNLRKLDIPLIFERPTAWAKTAYLGARFGWIVNDFKDNAIRTLMQSGANPKLNLLAEKYRPILPDELAFHGIGYDLMNQVVEPATAKTLFEKFLYLNEPVNKIFGKIDAQVDKMWRTKLFASELEKEVKRGLMKDYAANFAYRQAELEKMALSKIDDWAKNPAAYGSEIAAAQRKVMDIIDDTLYDSAKTLPFLTNRERQGLKTVLLFPEFMIDTMKKAAKLGVKYPYQSTALMNLTDMYNQYFVKEEERPSWLQDAIEVGKNIWLRPTAGTMFDPEWGLMNANATFNPLLQAAIETITGRSTRTMSLEHPLGEPLTDPTQIYYFNPLTQKMELAPRAETIKEIDSTIAGYQQGIVKLLNEIDQLNLSGPEIQARLSRIDQAQRMIKDVWQPQKEMYESGITSGMETGFPMFAEMFARKLPQYKLLEDMLQPYTKYETSSLFSPKVILDKRTGQPKHNINVWLQTLRLLGASVYDYDIEMWQKRQETMKKAQTSVTFGQLINRLANDDPDTLARLREDIIQGKVPLDWKELPWHEEIESMFGQPANIPPLSLPEWDLESAIQKIDYARQADLNQIKQQADEAKDNMRFFNPELLNRMRDTIDALTKEKESRINAYYDQMKRGEELFKMTDELKSAAQLQQSLEQMATPVTAGDIVSEIMRSIKAAGVKSKVRAAELAAALSEYVVDAVENNKPINYSKLIKEMAETIGQSASFTGQALLAALEKFAKIPAAITTSKQQADWATHRLEELGFIELKKQLTGNYPDTKFIAPDLQELLAEDVFKYYLGTPPAETFTGFDLLTDKNLEDALTTIEANALTAIEKVKASALPFGDMVIKSIEKKKKETIARTKKAYTTQKRMKTLFTKERVSNAEKALKEAIRARGDFLSSVAFQHWQDLFDPGKIVDDVVPISSLLTSLAAARTEIISSLGTDALKDFLESDEGKEYTEFEQNILSDYENVIAQQAAPRPEPPNIMGLWVQYYPQPEVPAVNAELKKFADAFRSFVANPSLASFKYLEGVHQSTLERNGKVPVFYREKGDLYAKVGAPSWSSGNFDVKLKEFDRYSRITPVVPVAPAYVAVEKATLKSYKTLSRKLQQGPKSTWFTGVLLQK